MASQAQLLRSTWFWDTRLGSYHQTPLHLTIAPQNTQEAGSVVWDSFWWLIAYPRPPMSFGAIGVQMSQ
jgi:hypothetical protein